MRRTLVTSLVLAFSFTALGGQVLAQVEADPSTSPSPEPVEAAVQTSSTLDGTLDLEAPEWRRIRPDGGPAAREDHTWTVDGEGRFAWLFGGRDGDKEFADLWRYDMAKDVWKRISPKGKKPEPRFGHNAVWAEGLGMVVFAGQLGDDFFDDLWLFDPDTKRWRELPTKGQVPKRRYGSCMVVGPDGRLWISHGFTTSGRFDDTRAYNLKTERWAVITPEDRKPGERCLHECFTSATGDIVLYGGQDDGAFALGDLWSMGKDRTWQRYDEPQAKWRRLYGVTEAGAYAYIFGGAGEDNAKLADVWRVDRRTLDFERVRVEGNHPAARSAGTLITDAERGRLLLFGGEAANGAKSDVWELVDTVATDEGTDEAETDEAETDAEGVTPETVDEPSDP